MMASKCGHVANILITTILLALLLAVDQLGWGTSSHSITSSRSQPIGLFNVLTADVKLLQEKLGNGSFRSIDLVEAYLAQIRNHDDCLYTIVSSIPQQSLLMSAESLDKERRLRQIVVFLCCQDQLT